MTVSTTENTTLYVADGVEDTFSFGFQATDPVTMYGFIDAVLQTNTIAVLNSDQETLPGGTVQFLDGAPTSGTIVTLLREVPYVQQTDYREYDPFPAETHEMALDGLTMQVQQLREIISRAPQLPIDTSLDGYNLGTPQANMVVMYNAEEDGQESTGVDAASFIAAVAGTGANAVAAAASADLSYNWAQQGEDIEVAAGEYSAYHWSQKAVAVVVAAAASADLAYNWAQEDEDVEVAPGEYSAYHWAQKAEAWVGGVVQVVNHQYSELATTVQLFSFDDIIPTSSEGDYLMEQKITPTDATGLLRIDVVANLSHSADGRELSIGLFDDTITNALACVSTTVMSHDPANLALTRWITAGTTNEITFIVRGGANGSGTTTFNGVNGSRRHGGVMASTITITEYKA